MDQHVSAGKRKGRCHRCNVGYYWTNKKRRLKDTCCPKCGLRLQATTHLFKGPWKQL